MKEEHSSLCRVQKNLSDIYGFRAWDHKNLVGLLNFIRRYHSVELRQFLDEYDEMLMGN